MVREENGNQINKVPSEQGQSISFFLRATENKLKYFISETNIIKIISGKIT